MNARILLAALAVFSMAAISTPAEARGHRHHASHHYRHLGHANRAPVSHSAGIPCVSDNSGRTVCGGTPEGHQAVNSEGSARVAYSGGEGVVGGRPGGCPHAFCGCGVSLKVFGRIIPELNLAANWYRFPRTSAGSGMVAIFGRHHVAYIMSIDGNGNATLYDPNSGGHQTRIHQRNIARATIVDPHGLRVASR